MTNYLKVYVINLLSEETKKSKVEALLSDLGYDFCFIKAVEGLALSAEVLKEKYKANLAVERIGRELTLGEIGCAMSHLSIYKDMVINNVSCALILEDDIETDVSVEFVLDILNSLPNQWDILLLGHHPRYSRRMDSVLKFWGKKTCANKVKIGEFAEQPVGGYSYIISERAAKKRLEEFSTIYKPVDYWNMQDFNVYGTRPALFSVSKEYLASNLDKEREEVLHIRSGWQKFKDRIRMLFGILRIESIYYRVLRIKFISVSFLFPGKNNG